MGFGTLLGSGLIGAGINLFKDAVWEPVKTGLGNLISGGTWEQSGQQVAQNEFNANEALKAHQRNLYTRDTAIESQINQLKKGGINTAMYFSGGGSGAATPTSSSAYSSGLENNRNTAYTGGYNGMANLLQAGANVAHVMNNDRIKGNNMNAAGVTSIVLDLAKLIGK